jgi:hypothetical protein
MWIEAILTPRDCTDFVGSITPLKVGLGGERMLIVEPPRRVELVPDKGLRLQTAGNVIWTVAGVKVPVKFRVASLLLTPSIEQRDGRDALALRARIEKLDVKVLPDFVDDTVLHRINDALAKADEVLVWRFSKMFDRQLALPQRIESSSAIDVHSRWGQVRITESALVIAVSLDVRAVPREAAHAAE